MTKDKFMEILKSEAIPMAAQLLEAECERLLRTGGIDLESFSNDDHFAPVKIVLAAAFPAVAQSMRPLLPAHTKMANNLKKF